MKRLTYISNFSRSLTRKKIENIENISQVNNAKESITGILLSCNRTFLQILEGDEDRIDHLVASRIESLTRQLNRFLVFSAAVRDGLSDHWKILKMGDFYAKGREAIVEVYSIDDPLASQKSDFYKLKQEIKDQLELIGNQTIEPCKQRKTLFMLYDR